MTTLPNNTEPVAAAVATFEGAWFAINALAGQDAAEVRIYDAIGAFGISAESFVGELSKIKARTINLKLNTPGGSVFDATAIYNALRSHPARVVTDIVGVAASAGSFIALAGDEVRIADNAYMMIHNARGGVMGQAEDFRSYADHLDTVNANMAGMYARKTGKASEYWHGIMDAETWFTAEQAKAEGLVDTIYTADKPSKQQAIRAHFDFGTYINIPDPVREMWGLQTPAASTEPIPITNAPEGSATVVEPSPAPQQEIPPMSESSQIQAAPAQNPAPATNGIPQGTTQSETVRLNDAAISSFIEKGKIYGRQEGRNTLMDEFRAIVATCPGRPQTAINAILAGQNASTVKLIVDAEVNAEIAANKRAQEQDLEIAKLRADQARLMELNSIGGHSGVAASVYAPAAQHAASAAPNGLEPEAQAELEWNADPMVRANNGGEKGKKSWMLFRRQELSGNVRVLKTA